jgi:hypothetical protein
MILEVKSPQSMTSALSRVLWLHYILADSIMVEVCERRRNHLARQEPREWKGASLVFFFFFFSNNHLYRTNQGPTRKP